MRKTSTYVPIRVPNALYDAMMAEIQRREEDPLRPPWTVSSFIQEAIREKVHNRTRNRDYSRTERPKKRKAKRGASKSNEGAER